MGGNRLTGIRVLLLEDETLINMGTQAILETMGCIVTSVLHASEAMSALDDEMPEIAVLDINLGSDRTSYDVAQRLIENGVPFVFLTGYNPGTLPSKWQSYPICHKPCHPEELEALMTSALARGQSA